MYENIFAKPQLQPVKMRDVAYDILRQAIIANKLVPGARLLEEHLARELRSLRWGPVTVGYGAGCDPSVPQAVAAARRGGAPRVAVAAYLLAPGCFHDRLQAAGADLVTAPLAPHPTLVEIALDRYEAAARSVVVGS